MMLARNFGAGRALQCVAAFSACLLAANLALAQAPAAALADEAITIVTSDAAAKALGGPASQLIAKAQAKGNVRVIVMLRIVMRMEHTLAGMEVKRQRTALRSVQDGVALRVLGSAADPDVVRYDIIPAMSVLVTAAELRKLIADPSVVSIHEDVPMHLELAESVPLIHADDLFAKSINGTGYTVAVVDTGVALTHPMLAGKIASEACYSTPNAGSGITSFCPGGAASSIAAGSAVNCPVALSGCEHGTHVASIAVGNSATLDGVARDARLIPIKIASRQANCAPNPSPCLVLQRTDQISALQRVYALRNAFKIAAVNMSYGGGVINASCDADPANAPYVAVLNNILAAGIAPVKSAGNSGSDTGVSFPGCLSATIAVGNSTDSDRAAVSSNISPLVELMAPGSLIKAAVPGNKYEELSGTSMAAPHVSGSFALLKNGKPTATVPDILAALTCSGKPIDVRNVPGLPEITPVLPRIDLIGAYYRLKKPAGATRTWTFTPADVKDWRPFRGAWTAPGGLYQPTPNLAGWLNTSVANCDSKIEVNARMKRVDPTPPNPTDPRNTFVWNSGIWVKASLNHGLETISGYFFAFNKAWWCAVTPPAGQKCPAGQLRQGQGAVYRLFNSNAETGTVTSGTLMCFKNMAITVNGFNTLRIVSSGADHTFYLNGKLVCSANDASFNSGAVVVTGWIPCTTGSPPGCAVTPGHQILVDTLSIKSLETTAPVRNGSEVMDPEAMAAGPPVSVTGTSGRTFSEAVTASR